MKSVKWGWVLGILCVLGVGIWVGRGPLGSGGLGVVDLDQLFKDSARAKILQEKLNKAQEEAKKVVGEEEAKVQMARLHGIGSVEFKSAVESAKKVVEAKQKELMGLNTSLTKKMEAEIRATCERLARRYHLTGVIHKRAMLSGGRDLTQEIISKLNEQK